MTITVKDAPILGWRLRDFAFEQGQTVILADSAGTAELVELIGGTKKPRRGSVRIGAADPRRSPSTRASLATLFATEVLPPGKRVEDGVNACLLLRGDRRPVRDVLALLGIENWADRALDDLGDDEVRALALALALSHPKPVAVVLHEPLQASGAAGASPAALLSALRAMQALGAPVVCLTASPHDAKVLGGRLVVPAIGYSGENGALLLRRALGRFQPAQLVVRTPAPDRLAGAISHAPTVSRVSWHRPRGDARDGEVRVSADDVEAASLAVLETATREGITLDAIAIAEPSLEEVVALARPTKPIAGPRPAAPVTSAALPKPETRGT